ncbi:MAG TPA: amino acid adenylation domain-containing protein, partial [Longimicrobiaceae bacterium]
LRGEALERQLSYWKARLSGAPALLELPTDRPRPQVQSDRGAHEQATLPRDLAERLRALARREGATLYMVVLAAFQALLSRYSGSDDVVVGSPVAGRTRREVEELIGFFVNTLVLRTDLGGDPSLRDVLRRVREVTLGAQEHQEMPFDRLVAELQPERSLGHSPLFQVMFSQRDQEGSGLRLPGLRLHSLDCDPDTVKFDLNLAFSERSDGLSVVLGYRTELFDRSTTRRMLAHLARVLEQIASDPDLRFSELEVLGEAERRQVVEEWNRTEQAYPREVCIHELFEAQVKRTPGAVAASFEGRTLSYAELNERANRLAHYLAAWGVGPEVRVGICMEPGLEMVVGVLAVLKAGGAYVPLDPACPAARLSMMLEDSAPAALLTQAGLIRVREELLRKGTVRVVEVDADAAAWATMPETNPSRADFTPERLCYVIYTSGSTGRPKGVMVQHRGVCNSIRAFSAAYRIGAKARVLFFAPLHFDASVLDIFTALCSGATLVVASREALMPGEDLLALLRSERVTHAKFTPSALAATPWAELPELKTVISTGEACSAEVVARWAPGRRFLNGYGPTEASVRVTVQETADGTRPPPIGRPVANVRLYVLDGWGSPVPVGVAGELYIGGVGVTRGYLGRPDLTAERFVPDAFGGEAGGRLYRSGDRVRWNGQGEVEFLGRMDDQVKIRGFRIEPGEIEAALVSLPQVREAAVVAREDAPEQKRLVGYVVPEAGEKASAAELRRELQSRLPEYMVPSAFVVLERLPLNANGKLDRRGLPAPDHMAAEEAYAAPRTPVEAILSEVWAETLRLERVGVRESFFELGGHSLLATRAVSRIREVFGVELPLRSLFQAPTVAEVAERVEALRRAGIPAPAPVVPTGRTGALPLSFAQERLWFIDRMEPGSAAYNVPVALRLAGVLDAGALERALGEIVRRHEALRTVFREVDGSPVQVVAPFAGFVLPIADLSGPDAETREAEASRRTREEAGRPFDLAAGPLFRAGLLRLGGEEHVLLLSMHHVVSDGWSRGVLFRELSALYAAYREGRESPLAEPAVQYADYAVWQREQLRGDALERQLAYWKERLGGAPTLLELPTDRPRPAVRSFRGAQERVRLPAAVLEALRVLGRREGATPYMVVLGAFQALLSRYAGSEDVVVGSPVAGRTRREVEELIGFFVNTLVLRTDLSGDPSFRELVGRVREVTLGAYEHQEVPFEKLVAELQPERSLGHSPLFQVTFSLDGVDGPGVGLAGLTVGEVEAEFDYAKFDLSLSLAASSHGLRGSLTYDADLWERGTMERMVRHLERVMEQVAAGADVRLSQVALLDGAERRQVVEEWNRTERAYPREVCIHELFELQAARRPGAPALVWGDVELSYAELNARADRLAHHLVRLGVGPDGRVGVLLERGVELVVSILAVLKAGGCYVPLDPGYPAERLRLMLEDSGVRVLLSRSDVAFAAEAGDRPVVLLDEAADALAREPVEAPRGRATAENLAYIVYTSGSTGRPKGVMVAHRHVVQLAVETDYVRFAPGDRVAQASNASFDALTFEAWGALMNGATLVGIPREVLLSPAAFRQVLREQGITTLYQTTALLNQLSREQPDIFAPLREVLFGGQAADAESVRRLLGAGKPRRLLHMYGPTETTAWCSYENVEEVAEGARTVPVGRATGNQRIYLLDPALSPVPVGVPGEAYVGGAGVVRGYLERPGLTAERFLPDPFATEPGARMYRTGDRLRWRGEGKLEFVGRLDEQIKIRGFRIEPGEIEATLSAHAEVREARVIVREDEPGEHRLVAYVVGEVSTHELSGHLRERLPEYMVPAAIVLLGALPLTPNGKLDHKALPAPEHSSMEVRVAPRTPVEEALAGIWAEVLRLEAVGVHDGFFALGGHSLLATRVVSRVREVFRVELPLRVLFEGPTVAELAGRVEEIRRAGAPALPPVVPVDRARPLPLSFAQERLWFLDRLEPGSALYNVPRALRLRGALDAAALERALGEIVRRHEALRTVFRETDAGPVQVVAPFAGFALPVEELAGPDQAERRAAEAAARPFDLSAGPLFRAVLLRVGEEEHVLLLCMHHVVSDGWSMGVLFRELSALYAAYREGWESPLAELAVQYADYAVWQREQLRGDALERQLGYWRERLGGAPALLELPTDHARPPVQSFRGASERMELPAALLKRLRELGRREGATLFMVVLGAFQALLSRYSGSEDVVVGSPVAGRGRREVEELIGFFVNTLVLRTDLSGDPSFRELVGRVREVTLGAYEHQEVPFEKLVAELQPERSLSHSPLFQVTFTLEDGDEAGGSLAGLETRRVEAEPASAKYDLMLGIGAHPQGMQGVLTYGAELFEPGTVRRMLRHLERVLEQVAEDPDVRLSGIELLSPEESRRVVEEWNRTGAELPAERCIHECFEEQVGRTPDAVAVVFEGEALSYAELDERANRLAHALRRRGVGPEVRVGLCVERSAEMVVAILGVLKAGGAYVPLDPGYPTERLAFLLEDSAVPVLLTQARLEARLPQHAARVLRLDADWCSIAPEPDHAPARLVSPRNPAYVIYTSGSTGRPKGVVVEHRGVLNLLADFQARAPLEAGDRCSVWTSLGFDVCVYEIFSPLLAGASLYVPTEELRLHGGAYLEWLAGERIRGAYLPPFLLPEYRRWVEEHAERACLGRLLVGVEPLSESLLAGIRRSVPGLRVVNGYGPTEATICSTLYDVPVQVCGERTAPIGRPVANTRAYVLDGSGRLCPEGVPGELHLGGVQLARGYLDVPELTAGKFVPDPFSGGAGERLYRTGDRVRRLSTGELEFLGRIDQQVKVRGFRIEPGEIESVLGEDAAVEQAVVVAREEETGKRLVAYVAGKAVPEVARLRERLRAKLPEYMVPGAIVVLERLPLTPNGKVDRGALPAPEWGAGQGEEGYVAPRTLLEEILCGIWAEVLRLERVGVHDNFFALGGHSLLATRVVSRVGEVLRVELPLRMLFEGPTVAELAGWVEESRREGAPALPPVVPVDRAGPLPLSFAQERLWFIDRMQPESALYNIPVSLRLEGSLDAQALERALGEIVRRHEALRTVFRETDAGPVQVVAPFAGLALPVEELAGLDQAERRAAEAAARPFDLSAGPLFRVVLLRVGVEEHVLLLCMHHVVSDGWSMGVLFREMSALYTAYRDGRESPLAELAVQYADYAVWQREQLRGETLERQLGYWRERLADAPALLELPTDHARPPVQSFRGASERMELPAALLERLRELGWREGATLYMVVLGAFQALLSRYSGSGDVVVGSPVAGRGRREVEELIGFFVNTLVLRTDLSGDPSFRELVGRVREVTLGAYEHQEVPFEKLVAELRPERSLSHAPLFQVAFTLDNAQDTGGRLAGLSVQGVGTELEFAKFDLSLSLVAGSDGLRGGMTYSTDLWEAATMQRLVGHFTRLVEQAAADPDVRISQVMLLNEAERRQVVEEWSRTPVESPAGACIHERVAAQAERTPEALAVVSGEDALTYRELDARADRLARRLAGLGAGPEVRVGVCLERSAGMVVALLAVLKAGAAYLPLDPVYPADRLAYMLADSGARVLVTQASLRGLLPAEGVRTVRVDEDAAEVAAEPDVAPRTAVAPENAAYVIYTSGSTGRPKGVVVTHANAASLLPRAVRTFGAEPGGAVLQTASMSFDASLLEVFVALLSGAALHVADRETVLVPERLAALLREREIGVWVSTPALLDTLPEADFPALHTVSTGGERCAAETAARWSRGRRLVNMYGPTETTIYTTAHECAPGVAEAPPIGRAVEGARVYVLDAWGEPAPIGVPGELYVGGAGVARG